MSDRQAKSTIVLAKASMAEDHEEKWVEMKNGRLKACPGENRDRPSNGSLDLLKYFSW
jgi:hypothetical protein